ncbi:MAG: glycerophosphodiester phosphodiesterase family protein [Roseburia sp.]|nr:glycerophosphodiester phosphodiesterase family protein [Roseburia sp.]
MMDLLQRAKEKKILLVAHRGTCGGNIPCNSMQAFQAAVKAGADMVELDVERTADGELFIQHPRMEPVHLRMKDSIRDYPASMVEQLRLSNWDLSPTQYLIPRLEQALTYLRGKCLVNIDKFWVNPEEIAALIHKLGMEDQVLIKTEDKAEYLDAVEKYASDIPFMTIARDGISVHEEMMRRNIRYVGIECLFDKEDSPVASGEFIDRLHADGKILWVNTIVYNYKAVLAAGHNDDISVIEDPEKGWGWVADRGFDMIQTDFVYQCRRFLEETGRRSPSI